MADCAGYILEKPALLSMDQEDTNLELSSGRIAKSVVFSKMKAQRCRKPDP